MAGSLGAGIVLAVLEDRHRMQLPYRVSPTVIRLRRGALKGAVVRGFVVFAIDQQLPDHSYFVAQCWGEIGQGPGAVVELCSIVRRHLHDYAVLLEFLGRLGWSRIIDLAG